MITTRKATDDDKAFLWHLIVASMRQYVEQVYGWDDITQYGYFENGFQPEVIQIIQYDRQDVGMFVLQEHVENWFLSRIEILPEYQQKGIGSTIIQRMIDDVVVTNKPFRLQVFKVNPARRLYERLGFVKTGESKTHIQMELSNKRIDNR
jgi:ribosomal protein S18 acetylase RimI-like enzyme